MLATDIALAALSGEGVYNFGEVLATPILGALEDTPNAWLGELLRVFAAGGGPRGERLLRVLFAGAGSWTFGAVAAP